ncbi:carboxypeptidase-like regulatory domain-containing protein [Micromonospora sp. NBS 11-29]|uniref:carboxypeptidase-like regulatory domain-containing protein n=1 Tax=Micromonospora sp. NBS 11-29 TaxID=1960879 RepID=UPI0011226DB2|nr:carboxypeptidase-like regulatory domain-containing protein [Micromonospora sp. NBS 11-29]
MSIVHRALAALAVAALAATVPITAAAAGEPATGVLHLSVTRPDGTPIQGTVNVVAADSGDSRLYEQLDESGRLSLELPPNDYKIAIDPAYVPDLPDEVLRQWVPGRTSWAQAGTVRVSAGDTTDVTERLLAPSRSTLRARDARTGAPVDGVCVFVDPRRNPCGGTEVTVPPLLPGPQEVWVYTESDSHLPRSATVTVLADGSGTAVVDLTPAAHVVTRVVDAATGAAVAGACVHLAPAGTGDLPPAYPRYCSDATGAVRLDLVEAGSWNLFARPATSSPYGAQWVGATGGTGDPRRARTVTVDAGRTVTVPPIRLDRAGVVTGTVTSTATGAPVTAGSVTLSHEPGDATPEWGVELDNQGCYRIDWLGPYRWPLLFTAADHATQWSGGAALRGGAEPVVVRAGATTVYSPALRVGTLVTGRLVDPEGRAVSAELTVRNADTGEVVGWTLDNDGRYALRVLGRQSVTMAWLWTPPFVRYAGWYDGATGPADATRVTVPATGTRRLDVEVDRFPAG